MKYFLDTNMPIGYTIIHDKHHENASRFIEKHSNSVFWSNFVEEEYLNTFNDISKSIRHFLDTIESILENNEKNFDYYLEFENFIINKTKHVPLDEFKKLKILENFWKDNEFAHANCENIYNNFVKFNRNFNRIYFKRDKNLNGIMKLHDCGRDNYLNYLNFALKLNSWGVHSPDYKIILDAHDCGIKHEELIFVSADGKIFEALNGHELSFLKIMEFKSCN